MPSSNDFLDSKSMSLCTLTFILNYISISEAASVLTAIAAASTIIYNAIRIIIELKKKKNEPEH